MLETPLNKEEVDILSRAAIFQDLAACVIKTLNDEIAKGNKPVDYYVNIKNEITDLVGRSVQIIQADMTSDKAKRIVQLTSIEVLRELIRFYELQDSSLDSSQ